MASPKQSYYVTLLTGKSILKGSYYTSNINLISPKKSVRSTLQDQIQSYFGVLAMTLCPT